MPILVSETLDPGNCDRCHKPIYLGQEVVVKHRGVVTTDRDHPFACLVKYETTIEHEDCR